MDKKLNIKIQKISPKIPDNTNNISSIMTIEADNELMLERKGVIYAVFDVSSKKSFDYLLIDKVVHDVLHDSYYQSETASPIQAVEKAVIKLRDNITKIVTEVGENEALMSFNIAIAVLWGNTLYLIQYGSTKIFLMRGGQIKPVSSAKEGSFSVASGVIKNEDVVILATENFVRTYPPEQLINTAELQVDNLDLLQSAMILKFAVTKKLSENEAIDFGDKSTQSIKADAQTKPKRFKLPNPINLLKTNKKLFGEPSKLGPIVALFIILSVGAILGSLYKTRTQIEEIVEVNSVETTTQAPEQTQPVGDAKKIEAVDAQVFYDTRLVEENSNPTSIALVNNKIVVSESTTGRVYVSEIDVPKLVLQNYTFLGIRNLVNADGLLGFADNSSYRLLNLETNSVTQTYSQTGLGITQVYSDYIYNLSNGTLTRYEKAGTSLISSIWAQDPALEEAVSMAINVSIYVLTDDDILKLTSGDQEDFEIKGDDSLINPTQIFTNENLNNIYIADAGNRRILIINEDGEVIKIYVHSNPQLWADMKGISVNDAETKMYVLDESKIYEVEITVPFVPSPTL